MSLLDKIEKVREKPEQYKYKIAVIWTILITAFIVVIWLAFIFIQKARTSENPYQSPFSIIKESLWETK